VCVYLNCIYFYTINSPYLLMFGNDHVIRYMRKNDFAGGAGET